MKLKLFTHDLIKAVQKADSITVKKNSSAVLGNVLFDVHKDYVNVMSTDMEISLKIKLQCDADSEGKFSIDGKKLSSIIGQLPDDEITMEVDDKFVVKIKSEKVKGKYKIVALDGEDFPIQENDINQENWIDVDQLELK